MKWLSYVVCILILNFSTYRSASIQGCVASSECGTEDKDRVKCSNNGHCFYDIYDFVTKTKENKTPNLIDCICNSGYSSYNYNNSTSDDVKCCYERKSQLYMFLFEGLIGFGLGHFYIGKTALGLMKMIVMIGILCGSCFISICFCYKSNSNNEDHDKKNKLVSLLFFSGICIWVTWQLLDIILIGLNIYKDDNGEILEPW